MTPFIQKIIFATVIGLASFGLLFAFVALPLTQNISQNKKNLAKKSQEYSNLQESYETLKKTHENAAETENIYKKVIGLWPDDKDVSNFIVSLEDLAIGGSLTFDNVSIVESQKVSKKADSSKATGIQFSFNTSGSFGAILETLRKLEKFERFNNISLVDLSTKSDGAISAKVSGEVYYGK